MRTQLERQAGPLDRETVKQLGDSFVFTPAGGKPRSAVGFIDPVESIGSPLPGARGAVSQEIVIELLIEDFPERPSEGDRFSNIPRHEGAIFQPNGPVITDAGFWRMTIKKVK